MYESIYENSSHIMESYASAFSGIVWKKVSLRTIQIDNWRNAMAVCTF